MTGSKPENFSVYEVALPEGLHSTSVPLAQSWHVKSGIQEPLTSYVALRMVLV